MNNKPNPQTHTAAFEPGRRRFFIRVAAGLAGAGTALGLNTALAQNSPDGPAEPPRNPQGGVVITPETDLTGTRLLLLGTRGGPGVDLRRAMTASAVLVDGTPYLVDCGYGTVRNLVACGLRFAQVDTVFFTHLHNDHFLDLAALLSLQWTGSKQSPTACYGPHGTAAMVAGAKAFFAGDVGIRSVDEGRTLDPERQFLGHDLAAAAHPAQVYQDGRVTVSVVENTHFPERARARMPHRSLSYRFDAKDRSIVFSGDTAYSANLVELARGADIYVSEIMARLIYDQMTARAKEEAARGNIESVARHVAETHSTPADVGRSAREAGVKTVVLNHLLPGTVTEGRLNFPVSSFIDGVREEFSGEIIVADDLMVI
jgi:ribonuclease BN (tRNA processing enzyme)